MKDTTSSRCSATTLKRYTRAWGRLKKICETWQINRMFGDLTLHVQQLSQVLVGLEETMARLEATMKGEQAARETLATAVQTQQAYLDGLTKALVKLAEQLGQL